ncbi:TonB-dependent receptor [uncultured Parasphingorhabdus sp.]|uniref:TonB-dependent receptor n=1 Tax=uncultured Parasphingorhabdus sp. TaxID=2709694 RepID=UPI0030DA58BC|tara:strand:- start:4967 stop:7429 length:2463 start_codon:yes stop_codon:yes gene_type:complete
MTTYSSRNKSGLANKTVKSLLLGSVTTLAFAGLAAPASAQDADGFDDSRVITVVARKQTESLQEVPVTVTAIGSATLEKYQVNEIADVVSRVPALNVQVGGSGSGGQISLRGVGSSNISASFDSAVAFDFDGVQVSTMRIVQAGFFDVEQIDILKGPQSLFFGKSASAGVFAIRSANPTREWEMAGKASYEFEENGYTIGGHISGPISDTLGIRVAAQYQDIEDYVKVQPGTPAFNPDGTFRDSRGLNNFVGRATLQWDPVDNFNANLKLNYVRNRSDGADSHTDISCGANGVADPVYLLSGAVVIPSNADCNATDGLYGMSDGAAALVSNVPTGSGGDNTSFENGIPFGKTDIFFGRLKWDLDLSETLTLSSVSGYLSLDAVDTDCYAYTGALAPGVAGNAGCSDPVNKTEQYTQELRITSDFDGMFNFMLGAFYEARDIDFNTSQQGVNISFVAPDPVTGFTYDWYKKQNTKTEALSFFASATLDLTDQLQLSGGVRWTDESKVSRISVPYVHSFLSATPAFINSGFFSGPIKFSDSNFSPEASIKYQATPDINVYASFKTGFKSGGIDNSALPSNSLLGFNDPDPAVRQGVADALKFDSETGLGGEIGVKAQFADRTVTLNTSVFYYVFDDLQVQNFDAAAVQFQTFNASQLTTQGVDVEWGWRTPVEGLNLSGSIAYTDAEFTAPFVTTSGEDINGRSAARAPKFAANAAFDWTVPMGNALELGLNGNLQYSGSYFTNEDSASDTVQDSYVSIDGSISVGDPDGKWKLSLVGVNLTDEIWINTSAGRPFLEPGVGDDEVWTQNRGRQVFVEAAFKF